MTEPGAQHVSPGEGLLAPHPTCLHAVSRALGRMEPSKEAPALCNTLRLPAPALSAVPGPRLSPRRAFRSPAGLGQTQVAGPHPGGLTRSFWVRPVNLLSQQVPGRPCRCNFGDHIFENHCWRAQASPLTRREVWSSSPTEGPGSTAFPHRDAPQSACSAPPPHGVQTLRRLTLTGSPGASRPEPAHPSRPGVLALTRPVWLSHLLSLLLLSVL